MKMSMTKLFLNIVFTDVYKENSADTLSLCVNLMSKCAFKPATVISFNYSFLFINISFVIIIIFNNDFSL